MAILRISCIYDKIILYTINFSIFFVLPFLFHGPNFESKVKVERLVDDTRFEFLLQNNLLYRNLTRLLTYIHATLNFMQLKKLFFLFLTCLHFTAFSTAYTDSLLSRLYIVKNLNEKSSIYLELSRAVIKSDFGLSAAYADSCIFIAEELGDEKLVAKAKMQRGNAYFYASNIEGAFDDYAAAEPVFLKYKMLDDLSRLYILQGQGYDIKKNDEAAELKYKKGIELAEKIENDTVLAKAYISLGILKFGQQKFYESTVSYNKGIAKAKKINDMRTYAVGSSNLANVYKDFGEIDLSIDIHFEMAQTSTKNNDLLSLSANYHNIGGCYLIKADTAKAIEYLYKAATLKEQISDVKGLISTYNNLIYIWWLKNDVDSAKYYCNKTVKYLDNFKYVRSEKIFGNLALVYIKLNQLDSARYFITKQEELDLQNNRLDFMADAVQAKIHLALAENNLKEVIRLQELELKNRDYLQENTFKMKANFFKEKMEYESIQQELSFVKEKEQFNSRLNYMFLVLIICIFIATGYMFYSVKKTNSINKTITLQAEELKDKNVKLNELLLEKESIMSIVAHDLRNPIHQINSLIQLVECNQNEEAKEIIELIEKACGNGLNLIEDLLIINSPINQLEANTAEAKEWITKEVQKFELIAKRKNIKLHLSLDFEQGALTTDFRLLSRIVDNLLSNAIKFTNEFSNVYISASKRKDSFVFAFKDEGQGIDPKEHHLLFQKYARISSKPTGNETSTGLGLAIVKKLTDQLNGTIKVESELGMGSTFTLEIPSAKA